MKNVKFYIESKNGHDELEVPEGEVQGEVEKQLVNGKWVTMEKKDGSTEVLSEQDVPEETPEKLGETEEGVPTGASHTEKAEDKPEGEQTTLQELSDEKTEKTKEEEWAEKFEKTESVTVTNKSKGG